MDDAKRVTGPDYPLIVKYFFTFFTPVTILIIIASFWYYRLESSAWLDDIGTNEQQTLFNHRLVINEKIKSITTDLMVMASQEEMHAAIQENSDAAWQSLSNKYLAYSKRKHIYDQIRFLNASGMERMRINYNNGNPSAIAKSELQFKGNRYYFQDTIKLAPGEIFVSPLDLNIEHDSIELPYKPMIRFGTPVVDKNGEKSGILLINYLGADLIHSLDEMSCASPGRMMLLNSQGYWLKGVNSDDEWGFMLEGKKDRTFGKRYPDAWQKINRNASGQFVNDHGLFTFFTVYPLYEGLKSSTGSPEVFARSLRSLEPKEYYWKIVTLISPVVLAQKDKPLQKRIMVIVLGLITLFACGSMIFTYSFYRCRHAEKRILQESTELKNAQAALRQSEEHFRDLIENTSDIVQNVSPDGSFVYVNQAWLDALGYSKDDLKELTLHKIIDPEQLKQCEETFSEVIMGRTIKDLETAFIAKDGKKVQLLGSVSSKIIDGKAIYTRGIFHDISERKDLEKKLQNSLEIFESLFENSLVGIYHFSPDRTLIRCNKRAVEMTGYQKDELIGSDIRFLHISEEHYREAATKLGCVYDGEEVHHFEFPFKRKDGSIIWCFLSGKAINYLEPERGAIVISDDITERKNLEEKLRSLSTTDQLTGAYNRRAFENNISKELIRAKRYNTPLSLILFDFDHFKDINDTFGHDVGDVVLQEVVNIANEQIREVDTLYRWGGEEFVILLPETEIDVAQNAAERLRKAVEEYEFSPNSHITISLGVSEFLQDDTTGTIIKRADNALYEAKQGGRNRVIASIPPDSNTR